MVVDQLRALLRHPDVIARTYREIQDRLATGPSQETTARLEDLCQRHNHAQNSIRAVLSLGDQDCGFMAHELKRLNGELKSLERSIRQLESQPDETESIELASVTDALQRIDPVWGVLHPEEQRRVLELLVEKITISRNNVEVRFRSNGIEQVVGELGPMGVGSDD